jgi:hypothetical protein
MGRRPSLAMLDSTQVKGSLSGSAPIQRRFALSPWVTAKLHGDAVAAVLEMRSIMKVGMKEADRER